MRSRYAAFALGLGQYLVETLAANHPDRGRPPLELARELGRAHLTQRFMGLEIFPARPDEVLFHARIFVQGRDHSFVELSSFLREADGWHYAAGELLPARALGSTLGALTRDSFLMRLKEAAPGAGRSAPD